MDTGEPTARPLTTFEPRIDILPPSQQRLWPELSGTPQEFTLYGGTAIALRLGHRPSVDFDFFAFEPFAPNDLLHRIPNLKGAMVRQSAPDTLMVSIERDGPVQLSFFGGLDIGQVAPADRAAGPLIKVASLLDSCTRLAKQQATPISELDVSRRRSWQEACSPWRRRALLTRAR